MIFAALISAKTKEECEFVACSSALIPVCAGDVDGNVEQSFDDDCEFEKYKCLKGVTGKV